MPWPLIKLAFGIKKKKELLVNQEALTMKNKKGIMP